MADKGLAKRLSLSSSAKSRGMGLPSSAGLVGLGAGPSSSGVPSGSKLPKTAAAAVAGAHAGVPSPGSPGEVPLVPYIKTLDNGKVLPKYTAEVNMADKGLAKRLSLSSSAKSRGMGLPSSAGLVGLGAGPSSSGVPSGSKLPKTAAAAVAGAHAGVPSPGSPGEVPLVPYIKTLDNGKVLPKYTAALSSTDDLVPAEDLDMIQLELELLLSTVALRYRVLKSEMETIDKADERRERKGKFIDKAPASPGKKKRIDEKQKLRESAGKLFGHHMKHMKMKNMSSLIPPSPAPSQNTDDSSDAVPFLPANHHIQHVLNADNSKLMLPKNDTPNKFWMSVEPYCMSITHEDLKLLDDLLEEYSGPLIPPIPELGPHYSTQWAADDIKEEQDNSKKSKGLTNGDVGKKEKVM
ncbi:conserved hypothetical protein [Culex quinquefasciatus]|uniref:Transcriptional adaptor 3 n=1 Tax=Culex quinquefasciatus TaxID=7176 RepID=B0XKI4_CULQU|nr:conserved hypothetical protein [Culex quinquefasciatus]|eukprot:XP_001870156.1 conserved hypothetical protein [Culex quinquefasciatus]